MAYDLGGRREEHYNLDSSNHIGFPATSRGSAVDLPDAIDCTFYPPITLASPETYDRLAKEAAGALGATHAFVHLAGSSLVVAASFPSQIDDLTTQCVSSFANLTVTRGETIIFPQGRNWYTSGVAVEKESALQSIVSCPLVVEGQVIGAITVGSVGERAFDATDVDTLSELLVRTSTMWEWGIQRERLQRRVAQLECLALTISELIGIEEETSLLESICSSSLQLFSCQCAVVVTSPRRRKGRTGVTARVTSGTLQPPTASRLNSVVRLVENRTEPAVVSFEEEEPRSGQLHLGIGGAGFRSGLVVPLNGAEGSIGALILLRIRTSNFDEESELAVTFANQIVSCLKNLRTLSDERERQSLKDELLSNVTHELKTPLSSIKGYSQLVARRLKGSVDGRILDMLGTIDSQSNEMSHMISQIHDLARIDRGLLDLLLTQWSFADLVKQEMERLSVVSSQHEFILVMEPDIPPGLWDKDRVKRVLANLISNAVKYSPKGGDITVTVKKKAGHLTVGVNDKGIGIAPVHQRKIFRRFYRVTEKGKERYPGMGIGLNLSNEIVKAHGGRMWVESEMGKGSTFFFTLPFSSSKRSVQKPAAKKYEGEQSM